MYKSGDTERTLDLRQLNRTVIQCTITPRTLNFEDEKTGALDTTNDDGGCLRRFKAEWDAEKKRKKFEELRSKAKTTLRLYDKVRRSIKAPQDFIPMGSRTEKVVGLFVSVARKKMQRDFKKRKLTMYEEQPFKKLSCRTEELLMRASGVHTLVIRGWYYGFHMLAEKKVSSLSRELYDLMLGTWDGVEVENETAITLNYIVHFVD
ncbi:hypothetical protein Tco_0270382 [Tanacetum coccineum]